MKDCVRNMEYKIHSFRDDTIKYLQIYQQILKIYIKVSNSHINQKFNNYDGSIFNNDLKEIIRESDMLISMMKMMQYLELFSIRVVEPKFCENLYNVVHGNTKPQNRGNTKIDKSFCFICGKPNPPIAHHLIPIIYGGDDKDYNMIPVCDSCHYYDPFESIIEPLKNLEITKNHKF